MIDCDHSKVGQVVLLARMADRGIVKVHFVKDAYFCHICYVFLNETFTKSHEPAQLIFKWERRVPNPQTEAYREYFDVENDFNAF